MAHRDFYPTRARIDAGQQPLNTIFHDVLLIPPTPSTGPIIDDEEFVRFPVVKVKSGFERPGQNIDPPELWGRSDMGQRKVLGVVNPEQLGDQRADANLERGPAFAVMPVRAEPGADSCAMCYLIDARNLVAPNAWTAEEWNAPLSPDLEAAPGADATEVEVLLGLSRGIVLRLKATGLDKLDTPATYAPEVFTSKTYPGVNYELEPVKLKREPEIWNQLRNGTVAGRALYRALQGPSGATQRVLPLVNVTSLGGGQ